MEKGYVYILTNPAFQEDWVKIGYTKDIDQRIKSLSEKTCLPFPFELYAYCKTCKCVELEKQIHRILEKYVDARIAPNREFFRIVPSAALKELRFLAMTIEDAEFFAPKELEEQKKHAAPSFRFTMVKLHPGDELVFEPNRAIVTIANDKSDNKIVYNDKLYTLSGFCKIFMPENKRNKSNAYQGPAYFSHNGELLVHLREKYEHE